MLVAGNPDGRVAAGLKHLHDAGVVLSGPLDVVLALQAVDGLFLVFPVGAGVVVWAHVEVVDAGAGAGQPAGGHVAVLVGSCGQYDCYLVVADLVGGVADPLAGFEVGGVGHPTVPVRWVLVGWWAGDTSHGGVVGQGAVDVEDDGLAAGDGLSGFHVDREAGPGVPGGPVRDDAVLGVLAGLGQLDLVQQAAGVGDVRGLLEEFALAVQPGCDLGGFWCRGVFAGAFAAQGVEGHLHGLGGCFGDGSDRAGDTCVGSGPATHRAALLPYRPRIGVCSVRSFLAAGADNAPEENLVAPSSARWACEDEETEKRGSGGGGVLVVDGC